MQLICFASVHSMIPSKEFSFISHASFAEFDKRGELNIIFCSLKRLELAMSPRLYRQKVRRFQKRNGTVITVQKITGQTWFICTNVKTKNLYHILLIKNNIDKLFKLGIIDYFWGTNKNHALNGYNMRVSKEIWQWV